MRVQQKFFLGCVAVAVLSMVSGREALARKQYEEAFKGMYVKEGTPLAEAVGKAKCNVCHVDKQSKKERNAYGSAIADLLGKKNEKDAGKIDEALMAAAGKPSGTAGATFGDLIKQGKLPGGE